MILQSIGTGTASSADAVRPHINARFAEVVSLNTLGLRNEARVAIASAEPLNRFRHEPQTWLRPFLEEQLNSITGFPRASIYDAERTTDMALALVPDGAILRAAAAMVSEGRRVTADADLIHQRRELLREFGAATQT